MSRVDIYPIHLDVEMGNLQTVRISVSRLEHGCQESAFDQTLSKYGVGTDTYLSHTPGLLAMYE